MPCQTLFRPSRRIVPLGLLSLTLAVLSHAEVSGPVVVLIGAPGSGKTTQAGILSKERGMAVISAADLISRNQQSFAKFKQPNIQGLEPRVDPALNGLVEEALKSINSTSGVLLDGYPAASNHGAYFFELAKKLNLAKPIVIHLQIPDDVARKRLKSRKDSNLEQDLKDYHRELDFAREYFTQVTIHDIDGTKKPAAIAGEIRAILKNPSAGSTNQPVP